MFLLRTALKAQGDGQLVALDSLHDTDYRAAQTIKPRTGNGFMSTSSREMLDAEPHLH